MIRSSQMSVFMAALAISSAPLWAESWVRGRAQIGGGASVDPLYQAKPPQTLSPTVSTGQFNDAQKGFYSQADMGNGALRGRTFSIGGNESITANPELGETVSFNNTTGTVSSFAFSYAVDGTVTVGSSAVPVTQTFGTATTYRTTFAQFALHIFPGNTVGPAGAANSWTTALANGQQLYSTTKDVQNFPTSGSLPASSTTNYTDTISGSLPLSVGTNTFDVVLVLAVTGSIPSTVVSSLDMNFSNTAALSITSPVAYTSNSGYLLTGNNVPEPTSLAGLALVAGGLLRRRRQA